MWHIGCGNEQGNFVTGCTNGTTPPPPPPPPVRFINAAGACLVPSGPYPCWTGGYGNGSVCPVVAGSCSDNSSLWGLDGGILTSHEYYPAAINVDCNKCTPGRVAKLYSLGGSSLAYNATSKQIAFTSSGCSTMCLTAGAGGAQPPCGGGEEPWMADQVSARAAPQLNERILCLYPALCCAHRSTRTSATRARRRGGAWSP